MRSVGVKGLYSGLQASVLGTAVSQGIYFYLCAFRCSLQTTPACSRSTSFVTFLHMQHTSELRQGIQP